ncbi:hypothetical protein [Planctellipticum variicoloris]|uniref:hypothetical protein n=1 Tax=Planctellipticum variicoloris TaxID=3064265 RepID=UPI0030133E96|nr:hypothetical protein SH412_002182 [Planctomycetaceae bacterium SH412]
MSHDPWPASSPWLSRRGLLASFAAVAISSSMATSLCAEDARPSGKDRDEVLKVRRFELMESRVAALTIESAEAGFPSQFASKPIFKYSDPARGYVAASVWKLGDQGRPKALLAVELDRNTYGKPCISYERSSLTETPFTTSVEGVVWSPKGTQYQFKPLPGAPVPAKTPQLRLIQMRSLANRFASSEVVRKEKCELRLLPQPVDRYTPAEAERADGAIFFFTFGTNPEVVLLIESDGERWEFAAGRMTGAQEVVLTIDNTIVWTGPPLQEGGDSPFTGNIKAIEIPGIAADGSEIGE